MQTNIHGNIQEHSNVISVIQTNFSNSLKVDTVCVIEKTDIVKVPASDNVLKNSHVVVDFQWNKKCIKCTFESLYKTCA